MKWQPRYSDWLTTQIAPIWRTSRHHLLGVNSHASPHLWVWQEPKENTESEFFPRARGERECPFSLGANMWRGVPCIAGESNKGMMRPEPIAIWGIPNETVVP